MRIKRILVGFSSACVLLTAVAIHFTKVYLSPDGVYYRMDIGTMPVGLSFIGAGDNVSYKEGKFDGPIIQEIGSNEYRASWFCNDKSHSGEFENEVIIKCNQQTYEFPIYPLIPADEVIPLPSEKTALISDIHADYVALTLLLQQQSVIDKDLNWTFGANHLVINGDVVDKGPDVYKSLWLLYRLEHQARTAGGRLHYILGNHEQYIMRGQFSRTQQEHMYITRQLGGFKKAFVEPNIIVDWLRSKPVIIKLGSNLITHGGISPQVLQSGLSLADLNESMRDYWIDFGTSMENVRLESILGRSSVTQYRGLVRDSSRGKKASEAHVNSILNYFQIQRIIVGHTSVRSTEGLFDGKVSPIHIKVKQGKNEDFLSSFVMINNNLEVIQTKLPKLKKLDLKARKFEWTNVNDWNMLLLIYQSTNELDSISWPY
jgi:hypothetical protein